MSVDIQVDEQSLRFILDRLGPRLYQEGVKRMMAEAAKDGQQTMESAIDGGTGIAVRSIVSQSSPTTADIFTMINKPTGIKIEEGRKPGDAPTLVQLARWQEGSARRRNLDGFSRDQVNQLREIQAAIKARGSKSKKYITKTRDKLKYTINSYVDMAARAIEAEWGRR